MEDRCPECGRPLEQVTMPHAREDGDEIVVFCNVPAKVCRSCGGIWLAEETLAKIDQLIASPERPRQLLRTWDFALVSTSS